MSATAIALAASAVLCIALTTDVVIRVPGTIVVPEGELRRAYTDRHKAWAEVHRALDVVDRYRGEIQFGYTVCAQR